MKKNVLIVGHADADGHIIAEQLRRNLSTISSFSVAIVVDPVRTKDHRTWMHLQNIGEIDTYDIVFFADLMFAPASFSAEADALVDFVKQRPEKRFFVLDHHPLPLRRLGAASNLRALYRPDVIDCTVGPASRMMVIAALCEKQATRATNIKTEEENILARGIRRAAAVGGPLPGEKLSVLLRFDRWKELEELGLEDADEHKLPRGRRPSGRSISKTLKRLDETAAELLKTASLRPQTGRSLMPYELETSDKEPPKNKIPAADARDLEAITTLLELAAIYLTPEPGADFTLDQLLEEANAIAGDEIKIDRKDAVIVLDKASFLKKEAGKRLRLR